MKFFLFFQFLCIGCLGFAGGWSGNGGDYTRDQNNPWFLGTDPVSYCILKSADYPLKTSELSDLIKESLYDWRKFFSKYGIDKFPLGESKQGQFPDKQYRGISLDFIEKADCDPLQEKAVAFYFGVTNVYLEQAIANGAHHSAGLALRQEYDHQNYRNSGFVWIKNFSSEKNKIRHMLLHEMGHMFGMKHNSTYVMDMKVADLLEIPNNPLLPLIGSIEAPFWKYDLSSNEKSEFYKTLSDSKVRDPDGFVSNQKIPKAILDVLRISTQGYHKLSLVYLRSSMVISPTWYYKIVLELKGDPTPKEYMLSFNASSDSKARDLSMGVYTKWIDPNGQENFYESFFETANKPRNFNGSISFGQQRLGATLNTERNPVLKIFEPSEGIWWELR